MNKEIIDKATNTYNEIMKKKQELVQVKQKLMKMENIKDLNGCLEVIEREERKIPSDDECLRYSFYNTEQEDSICNIYVFMGAYCKSEKALDKPAPDYRKADYFVYQNIEKMFSGKIIFPDEYIDFEKNNIVLRFENEKNIREKFLKLQSIYFMEYLKDRDISEEKVLEKLKKSL